MTKLKKVFYSIWAGLTLILILFGWWQTQRLNSVSTERNRIRYTSINILLNDSQDILDVVARQMTKSPCEQTQAALNVAVILDLLDAAAKCADSNTAADIRTQWDSLTDLSSKLGSPDRDEQLVVQDALRGQAERVRKITQDFTARQ